MQSRWSGCSVHGHVGALVAAQTLGHRHHFDIGRITHRLDDWATLPGVTSTSGLVLLLLAILLAAAGAGVTVQALGSFTERVWLADRWQSWLPPLRRLAESRTKSRKQRWTTATTTYQRQLDAKSAQLAHRRTETSEHGSRSDATTPVMPSRCETSWPHLWSSSTPSMRLRPLIPGSWSTAATSTQMWPPRRWRTAPGLGTGQCWQPRRLACGSSTRN
ncbi:MAG: hypothetical protein ACRDTA_21815 [Pseudonocardiaceae bacterium]